MSNEHEHATTVLLTGATGFLGMEVLARLLEEPTTWVLALIRAEDDAAAAGRLDGVFAQLGEEDHPGRARVRAVRGDIAAAGLGLSEADRALVLTSATRVVHCAASIEFGLPLEEACAINIGGTRHVLEIARAIHERGHLDRFVHVSTAYVAGLHPGTHREEDLDLGQGFRNSYEQSKFEAEQMLRSEAADLPLVVVRPSIVVGDQHTGWTPAFNVIYWPLQAFARGLLTEVPADPQGVIDIVPVDYVADGIIAALHAEQPPRTVSLVAGKNAATTEDLVELTCGHLGRERPTLTPVGQGIDLESGNVYLPYFDVSTRFDNAAAVALLGKGAPPLGDYFPTMLDYATGARWGKRKLTRRAARAIASGTPAA